jgi:hypothetical protein
MKKIKLTSGWIVLVFWLAVIAILIIAKVLFF